MTKTFALVAAALCLSACGGNADFTGAYSGSGTQSGTCSDGSSATQAVSFAWNITQNGSSATIGMNGQCGLVSGTVSGDTISVQPKACGATTNGTTTVSVTITGGTLTKRDDTTAGVSLNMHGDGAGGGSSASCNFTISGTLTKQ